MSTDHTATIIPCLGRPFAPGMLYDCRSDQLVPGMTLWKSDKLKSKLDSTEQKNSDCEVIVEDTLKEKTSKFDVNASLKLSLMSGLLSLDGSAKYLNDRKESTKQARVSLKYSKTSHFDKLTMDHLSVGEVDCPEAFENNVATHVVIGVVYGADAVFIFDREVSSLEEVNEANTSLKLAATAIKETGGGVDGQFSETIKETSDKISCKFYGDFQLDKNPSTFLEAINIYKELPTIIKTTVPKKAYLYPLSMMESRAAKLVKDITLSLVQKTENILEKFQIIKVQANDLQKSYHPMLELLKKQVNEFRQEIDEFELDFKKQLNQVLPKIRGGTVEESDLVKILNDVNESPMNPELLQAWLIEKQTEGEILNDMITQLTKKLKADNVIVATSRNAVNKLWTDLQNKLVLALVIYVDVESDLFLKQLTHYCHVERKPSTDSKSLIKRVNPNASLINVVRSFIEFVSNNLNNDKEQLKFMVYAEPKVDNLYAQIQLYNIKEYTKKEFIPPTPPGKPSMQLEKKLDKFAVNVTWEEPKEGRENVTFYRVQYLIDSEENDWTKSKEFKTINPETNATVQGLQPDVTYLFRVCSVCEAGDSHFSDPISIATVTESPSTSKEASKTQRDSWVTVSHHAPFPANAVKALGRELKGGDATTRSSYVAIWSEMIEEEMRDDSCQRAGCFYVSKSIYCSTKETAIFLQKQADKMLESSKNRRTPLNRASFGRAWNNNGRAEAWFPWAPERGRQAKGYIESWFGITRQGEVSSADRQFQLLTSSSADEIYRWVKPADVTETHRVITVDGLCPAVITRSNMEVLGMAELASSLAWSTYGQKEFLHKGAEFDDCLVLVRDA